MCVVCLGCHVGRGGKKGPQGGKTRVVETRLINSRVRLTPKAKHRRTYTIRRIRECLGCKRRWTTTEMPVPGSFKGFGRQ